MNVAVIGGGINGLVAANYLRRAGASVTLFERMAASGGACIGETVQIDDEPYEFPLGATVLGLMQRFVFEESGLADRVAIWAPTHPKLVYFGDDPDPVAIHRDSAALTRELLAKCDERGDIERFRREERAVVTYLQDGFRAARAPAWDDAARTLGTEQAERWLRGTADALLKHYFTSERTRMYMAMTVIESGPVSLSSPSSAFNVPLLDSGSVFDGYYGFVEGGIWKITETLADINSELGVQNLNDTPVERVDGESGVVSWTLGSQSQRRQFDRVVFATDPLSAARLTEDPSLIRRAQAKKHLGTAGKMVLVFRKPVRWKDDSGVDGFESAFRFVFYTESLDEMERRSQAVVDGGVDFAPGYLQIYCDGAGMRRLGSRDQRDRLIVFFKNLSFDKAGEDLVEVRKFIEANVLTLVDNPEDLAWSRLWSPRDLRDRFLFPEGNVDHTMMTTGQNFHLRHYSSNPEESFYRFGDFRRLYYCGAAAYPCGSVAGTAGYMCARSLLADWND